MKRFYWYCSWCHRRGNKLYDERKDAKNRVDIHNRKCQYQRARIMSTKSTCIPIHVRWPNSRVIVEDFNLE